MTYQQQYYKANREKILAQQKAYVDANPRKGYMVAWRIAKKVEISEKRRRYYQRNKAKRIAYGVKYKCNQYKTNPQFALLGKLRSRVRSALKNGGNVRKSNPTLGLIGCDIPALMHHLESKFLPGMNWDNFGQWHIDHVIPCSKFDLSNIEEQKKCFHYTNLQPLWVKDNFRKGNRA